MRLPIDLPLSRIIPPPEVFAHRSTLHGQAHVARVMVHAFRLIEATSGAQEYAARLWAAVYLHDIARQHDGRCYVHGENAVKRLSSLPDVRELLRSGGVKEDDLPAIETAVIHHCKPDELPPTHEHYRLTALLKDADGLDRVRLGDLNAQYLRHEEARGMIGFAQRLFDSTDDVLEPGADYFAQLWPIAERLARV